MHDDKATITLGQSARPRCVQVDARSIRCSGLSRVRVSLGDGNDRFTYEGFSTLSTDGGPGDDQLTAFSSGGTTRFDGGPGRDICAGDAQIEVGCEGLTHLAPHVAVGSDSSVVRFDARKAW